MRTRLLIGTVILVAGFACTGGPISELPVTGDNTGFPDAGLRGPPKDDEGPAGAADVDASEPRTPGLDAAGIPTGACPGDASLDEADAQPAAALDAGDASASGDAGDAGASGDAGDATTSGDASDADASGDAGYANVGDAADGAPLESDANFTDASSDAEAGLADASGDAAYSSSDGASCSP